MKVLIVDDSEEIRNEIKLLLDGITGETVISLSLSGVRRVKSRGAARACSGPAAPQNQSRPREASE